MAGERQFSVDPEDLHRLAGDFDHAADRLATALSRFATAGQPHGEAFGLLPQARGAHERYVAKAQEGLDGLHAVHGALRDSLAGGLRVTAANYARSDQDSVER
jgi:hypothetical protein